MRIFIIFRTILLSAEEFWKTLRVSDTFVFADTWLSLLRYHYRFRLLRRSIPVEKCHKTFFVHSICKPQPPLSPLNGCKIQNCRIVEMHTPVPLWSLLHWTNDSRGLFLNHEPSKNTCNSTWACVTFVFAVWITVLDFMLHVLIVMEGIVIFVLLFQIYSTAQTSPTSPFHS
jgi:hypothetical protein